ncbi:hypothetical protein AB6A40_000445 [Gnathostoma spinigerum]|uniref:Glutathione S-transferase n=1 Tax=Gnathostoma spinigerum TaxID=75299 RepID=A0ABD6E8Q3_9BILA
MTFANLLSPKFKVYDFDDRSSADVIRIMFKAFGAPYEEVLVKKDEQWDSLKEEMPLRSLPVLEVDGVRIGGLTAICRQLAWRFGLSGRTATEDSLVDMIADVIHEAFVTLHIGSDFLQKADDEESKKTDEKMKKNYLQERIGPIIEKQLLKNGNGFLVGDQVTWVDLLAVALFKTYIDNGHRDYFEKFPNLLRHYDSITKQYYSINDMKS